MHIWKQSKKFNEEGCLRTWTTISVGQSGKLGMHLGEANKSPMNKSVNTCEILYKINLRLNTSIQSPWINIFLLNIKPFNFDAPRILKTKLSEHPVQCSW